MSAHAQYKTKTLTLEGVQATIRFEPRQNRMPYRLTWFEEGTEHSEMLESAESAETCGWAKLKSLVSGARTLTQDELQDLLQTKLRYEALEQRLKAAGWSIEIAMADLMAACNALPGWLPSQMAEFLAENHVVKNRMKFNSVVPAFMSFRRSGKERDYKADTLSCNEFTLKRFCLRFGEIYTDRFTSSELLDYVKGYQTGPTCRRRPEDDRCLHPAGKGSKWQLFGLLNQLLKFARDHLGALPPHAPLVTEGLDRPQRVVPSTRIFQASQIVALFGAAPDIDTVLYIAFQAYAGLKECEAKKVEFSHIVFRSAGIEPHILVEKSGGRKDPLTGVVRRQTYPATITSPLEALLEQIKDRLPGGRLIRSKSVGYKLRRTAALAGVPWIPGGLQNTFVANRLAEGYDLSEVAYETGTIFECDIRRFLGADKVNARAHWKVTIRAGSRVFTATQICW